MDRRSGPALSTDKRSHKILTFPVLIMKRKEIADRLRYALQYVPLTRQALLVGIALWACYRVLYPNLQEKGSEISSYRPLISIMGKVAFGFVVALIAFSLLSALICWLYGLWLVRRRGVALELDFKERPNGRGLWLESLMKGARRPFLGFIKARLVYDGKQLSDTFLLASNQGRTRMGLKREAVSGKSVVAFPDIREYDIDGAFVYFEDMLRLFSFPIRQKKQGRFYQPPRAVDAEGKEVAPKKTEQTDIRIERMRRVEGEYLNYKDFETGDDLRRVVWKVYARSRELVVRIPEIMDPYASHIYFYASFYTDLRNPSGQGALSMALLNHYKNRVWTAYDTLQKQGIEVRYKPDRTGVEGDVQRQISQAQWQDALPAANYFDARQGSVLCISSMNEPDDVRQALDSCGPDTVVYFIKLSDTFKSNLGLTLLARIFLRPPDDPLKRLRLQWSISPLRLQLLKREKAIEGLLNNTHAEIGYL